MQDWHISITAIAAITLLEGLAILNHVDGTYFAASLAVIGGIAGYHARKWIGGTNGKAN